MTGYEEKVCHCGEDSDHLSNLSYGEPLVASSSGGPSFPKAQSPGPIPILPPTTRVAGLDLSVSSSGTSDLDKENSRSEPMESTQSVVTDHELVEIQEVDDDKVQALSDVMDLKVRSCLYQRCRSKNHPEHFAPYPKGWQNGLCPREQQ